MLMLWTCGAWAAPTVEVSDSIPRLTSVDASQVVSQTLEAEGIAESSRTLSADVTAQGWRYEQGLLQVELTVAWSVGTTSAAEPFYQGETRGLATQHAPRRALARQHRRRDTLEALPSADAMRLDALRSATRSLISRDSFREVWAPPSEPVSPTDPLPSRHIDFADRSKLGTAPPHLRDPVTRSGAQARTTGIVVALVGMLVSITSRGSYLVSQEDPRDRRAQVRAVEVSGWSMMAGGGALWFHGDRRARSW